MSGWIKQVLKPVASLRLTVALFAAAMVLIFVGTVAQKDQGNWQVVNEYFRSIWLWMPIGIAGVRVPFVGGYTLGILMLVNLTAAHTVRFKFSWKRAGIIITHLGMILLILGEILTGLFSVEWNMTIDEGQSINYAEDIRVSELAVTDPSDPEHDDVVVIPQGILAGHADGAPIHDPLLPFDIQVLRWMPHSGLAGLGMADPALLASNPATHGFGTIALAMAKATATGVDGGEVNAPSAYLRLTHNGQVLGTYLVSLHGIAFEDPRQPVTVGGKTYLIELRFRRDYKPYTMHLIDFKHDKFVGTEIAKNFSSQVRLVDPTQNEDREALIYMNHPLRYRGETFYQASFKRDESGTILQVVRNPGWLMPYIACSLVSIGLIVHFGVMLGKFVGRTRR